MKYFAYGTLKRGFPNYPLLEYLDAKFVGSGFITGYKMYDLGNYPTIVKSNNEDDIVYGEVFEVEDFNKLDILEGVKWGLYERITLPVNGEECYVYVCGKKNEKRFKRTPIIGDGIWHKNKKSRSIH